MHLTQLQKAWDHENHSLGKLTNKMGLLWSTERGKVHSSSELNEDSGELEQEDGDSNCDEIFYESVDNVSSLHGDLAPQNLSADSAVVNSCSMKEPHETSTVAVEAKGEIRTTYHQQEVKIPDSSVYKIRDLSNFNAEASRNSRIATGECEEEDTKKWTCVSCRDLPLLEEEDQVMECSNFSLPVISEKKVFRDRHFKSVSDPQMLASVDSSQELKPDIPRSCSWQVDVECFKSKKRKKPPKKYLRAKEQELQYDDSNKRSATRDKQELQLYTKSCLASSGMATQEMMARRKVLDIRRW